MNWNLVSKGKDGETEVNLTWICLLVSFFGFLFGLGFTTAYLVVESILNGDGIFYRFIETNKIFVIVAVFLLAWAAYLLMCINSRIKKGDK